MPHQQTINSKHRNPWVLTSQYYQRACAHAGHASASQQAAQPQTHNPRRKLANKTSNDLHLLVRRHGSSCELESAVNGRWSCWSVSRILRFRCIIDLRKEIRRSPSCRQAVVSSLFPSSGIPIPYESPGEFTAPTSKCWTSKSNSSLRQGPIGAGKP